MPPGYRAKSNGYWGVSDTNAPPAGNADNIVGMETSIDGSVD